MEYLGLLFEVLLLGIGIYLYLFSSGRLKAKDAEAQKKADAFRQSTGPLLKYGSLLLIAILSVEIILHIKSLI